MNREELDREIKYADLLDALAAAKKGKDRDKLHEAKMALFTFREEGRATLRQAKPGEATPAPLKVKAKA